MKKILIIILLGSFVVLASTIASGQDTITVETEFLFDLHVDLDPPQPIGAGPYGLRIIFPATGGTVEGPNINGVVLAGGADWSITRNDGVFELDARVTILTDDDQFIYMSYMGYNDGEYWRVLSHFETGSEEYSWLNKTLAVGIGTNLSADEETGIIEWVEFKVFAIK